MLVVEHGVAITEIAMPVVVCGTHRDPLLVARIAKSSQARRLARQLRKYGIDTDDLQPTRIRFDRIA